MQVEFGYFPQHCELSIGNIAVSTLPDLESKISTIEDYGDVDDRWIFARNRQRVFALPKTHSLTHLSPTNEEHLDFLVWCFGFFVGMRMTSTEAGFCDASPLERGAMNDILWGRDSLAKAMDIADKFWQANAQRPNVCSVLTSAFHSYFMAGTRGRLSFEKFIFLYIAFDSCFAVHSRINGRDPRRTPHGDRIQQLCTTYLNNGIAPNWASASRPFAALRNDSFHEGIFFDEPLGFAPFGSVDIPKNVLMEMTALLSRLLIAIVGIPAKDYLRSPVDTRQRQLIQL